MRVLILAPRLDCMFKEGPVPEVEGPPNDPIRVHWANLVKRLTEDHEEKGDTVEILKKPLCSLHPRKFVRSSRISHTYLTRKRIVFRSPI